jgi:hypothetical protein
MTSIDDERNIAERAGKIFLTLSISSNPSQETIKTLRLSAHAAVSYDKINSSGKPLCKARAEVGLVLPDLIAAIEKGQITQQKIDRAKYAIRDWNIKLTL